jgi:hypothetical protein
VRRKKTKGACTNCYISKRDLTLCPLLPSCSSRVSCGLLSNIRYRVREAGSPTPHVTRGTSLMRPRGGVTRKGGANDPPLHQINSLWCSWLSRSAVIGLNCLPKGHRLDSGRGEIFFFPFLLLRFLLMMSTNVASRYFFGCLVQGAPQGVLRPRQLNLSRARNVYGFCSELLAE